MARRLLSRTAVLLGCTFAAHAAHAQLAPAPQPGSEQPRADVTRQVPGGELPRADVTRTLPGGVRPPTPGAGSISDSPLVRPAVPRTVPAPVGETKPRIVTRGRATGDDDEMDDLDIQRRKLQGQPANRPDAPPRRVKPGGEVPRDAQAMPVR